MEEMRGNILQLLSHPEYKVQITRAGKSRFQSNYKFEKDRHVEREINVVLNGCCVMEIHNEYVPLKEGDCIMIRPYEFHSCMVDMSKNCSMVQLKYSVTIPRNLENKIPAFRVEQPYYKVASCEIIGNILENLARNCRREHEMSGFVNELILAQLYVELSRKIIQCKTNVTDESQGIVGVIIEYINCHFEEELVLEEIASKYHVSSRYIRRYFQKNIGMNCMQYIALLRIGKAKEMLWNTDKSITEIAMSIGFNSSQYFSRIFKKYMGITPGEYRDSWRPSIVEEDDYEEI